MKIVKTVFQEHYLQSKWQWSKPISFARLLHYSEVKSVQNQSFKTTAPSQNENDPKSVSRLPQTLNITKVKKHFYYKAITTSQGDSYPKSVCQDHNILSKWQWSKTGLLKITTPSKINNGPKSFLYVNSNNMWSRCCSWLCLALLCNNITYIHQLRGRRVWLVIAVCKSCF